VMGQKKKFKQISERIKDLITRTLEMEHVKDLKKIGVFIHVFDKKTGNLLIGKTFGLLTLDMCDEYSGISQKKAVWLYLHPWATSSLESNGEVPPGAISGRRHVVSVSAGLESGDESALAVLVLSELERKRKDFYRRNIYIAKAECKNELFDILDFLETVFDWNLFPNFDID
jgi:hypothetical protein